MLSLRRHKMLVFAYSFTACFAPCLLVVAVPVTAYQRFGATQYQIGMMVTLGALLYTVCAFGCGRLADRIGYRLMIGLSGLIFAVSVVGMFYAGSFTAFVLANTLSQVGMALFWPVFMAWMASGPAPSALPGVLMIFNIAWCTGQLAGDCLSGDLFGRNAALPFFSAAGLLALFGAATFILPASLWRKEEPRASSAEELAEHASANDAQGRMFMWLGWTSNFVAVAILFAIRTLFPPLAVDLGFAPRVTGLLLATMSAAQLTAFWLFGRWTGWHRRLWPLAGIQLLAAGACLLAVFGRSPWPFAVAFVAAGGAIAVAFTASLYYSVHGQKRKGRQVGIHEAVCGLGGIVGPILMGAAANTWHPHAPYSLSAAAWVLLTAGQLAVLLVLTRRAKR